MSMDCDILERCKMAIGVGLTLLTEMTRAPAWAALVAVADDIGSM